VTYIKYEISIIGAGPAGCAAALALQSSGLKVALIDKEIFPREKVCGDAIPGPGIKALTKAFPFIHQALFELSEKQRIRYSRVVAPNGRAINYSWQLPAYNIKRRIFDNFLLELVKKHTDTSIINGFELKSIERNENFLLHSGNGDNSISTRFIIGCDGAGSVAAKSLHHPETKRTEKVMAVRAYYNNVDLDDQTNHFFVLKKYLPGYVWVFPLGDGLFNVGFGIKLNKQGKADRNMKESLEMILQDKKLHPYFKDASIDSEIRAAIIPLGGKKERYSGEGYLLAGDAAQLADPLKGHGIDKALVSGMLAGMHAMHCFKENIFSADFNMAYDRMIMQGIGKELRKSRRDQRLLNIAPGLLSIYARIKS
jgi:geranylgeranyl reductase family protein